MQITHYLGVHLPVQSLQKTFSTQEKSSLSARESQLLNTWLGDWERKSIQYFLDNRYPSGLVLDRARLQDQHLNKLPMEQIRNKASIAATGYGLLAWVLAVEHKMLTLQKARDWTLETLNTVKESMDPKQCGWIYHFLKAGSGKPYKGSEISSVDTTILLLGALIAGEYFGGKVKQQAKNFFDQVDFSMMLSNDNQFPNKKVFSHGFLLKNGQRDFIQSNWDTFSEGIIVSLLALGATSNKVSDKVWSDGWNRIKYWEYGGLKTFLPLPLFTYFYPLGFFNLKDRRDSQGENFWKEAQKAIKMQLAFCENNGYPKGSFGLTSCNGPNGYTDYSPSKSYSDKTISPVAILACLPLDEKNVFEWLHKAKQLGLDQYEYGLVGAYDPKSNWKYSDATGINIGSTLLMTDAYERGLIYKLSDQSEVIRRALHRAGFL